LLAAASVSIAGGSGRPTRLRTRAAVRAARPVTCSCWSLCRGCCSRSFCSLAYSPMVPNGRVGWLTSRKSWVVKPSSTEGFKRRFKRQAFRCETAAEVDEAFAQAEPYEPMVQELIPGGDDELYTLGSYLRADGEALGLFSGRKLRQTPPGVGTCRVGEALWVDEVVEQGLKLLRALSFHGLSQVELKRDPRDGAYKLMEVNPRLFQWHGLAAACGVDLPLIAYRDLTGEQVEPVSANGAHKRWAITLLPGESPAPQRPPYVDAVFARDDLKPALVQVARLLRR